MTGDAMVLLLFDRHHPCWDDEAVALMGEDPGSLKRLCDEGLLKRNETIYSLTPRGMEVFKEYCSQSFCESVPGESPDNSYGQAYLLWRTKFKNLLDQSFTARWGAKEFYVDTYLEYAPALPEEELYHIDHPPHVTWTYDSHPAVERMKEDFPILGLKARDSTPPSLEVIESWYSKNEVVKGSLYVDLLLLNRCDFAYYMHHPKHPNDVLGLVNADRFYCFRTLPPFDQSCKKYIDIIGKIHLFLLNQRRLYIPGYVDVDSADQDSLNWVVWVVDTEKEAISMHGLLAPMGESLIGPAHPMDVWVISLEALRSVEKKYELIYDLFPNVAHPIVRSI